MVALILFNLVPLAIALLIGIATGRWMFPRRAAAQTKPQDPGPS
jgi:hypothetical protein